jgi:uncharacterized protein (DUF433 family)
MPTTQPVETMPVQQTEHPYIVRVQGICGGRPIVKDTRISVQHIAELYKAGHLVEEIVQAHPQLSAAAVFDAISYYLDHQAEIEQEINRNRFESLVAEHRLTVDKQGFVQFPTEPLPPGD